MAPRRGLDTVESDGGRHRPASTKVRAADSVLNHSAKAIDVVTKMGPQLAAVLLDMTMPILSGADVLPHLKRLAPGLPVIGSSGHSEITARADFGSEDLAGFVQKPYSSTKLVEAVTEALARHSWTASISSSERFRS